MVIAITTSILFTASCKILKSVASKLGEKAAEAVNERLYEKFFKKREKLSELSVDQLKDVLKEMLVSTDEVSGKEAIEIIEDSLTELSSSIQDMRNDINELRILVDNALDEMLRYSHGDVALQINNMKHSFSESFIQMSEDERFALFQGFEQFLAPYFEQIVSHVTEEHGLYVQRKIK